MKYLAHRITKDGLVTLESRVRADFAEDTPSNVTQVKSFMGMLIFCLRFLPHLTTILQPLHQLLKKGQVFRPGNNQERAFNEAKELLQKSPVQTNYDVYKPILLTSDSSSYGVGAVVAHQIGDGEHPIAFHSRTMAYGERNYSHVEKEALAMIYGVRKFHKYLWDRHFKIFTDPKWTISVNGYSIIGGKGCVILLDH